MPRFFFHLRENGKLTRDLEGLELSGTGEAKDEAEAAALDMIDDRIVRRQWPDGGQFEIVDETGNSVATVPVGKMLNRRP